MVGAEELCDTVFLKGGGVIAGKVVAWMPGQAVKLQTSDGQYVFRLSDVERTAFHTMEEDSPAFELKMNVEETPVIPAEFALAKPSRTVSLKVRRDSIAQANRCLGYAYNVGGTVVSTSVKVAGDDFDEAIVRYMRKKHNLLIGERTAEDIKIKVGTCYPRAEVDRMNVRGRNLVTGLPKTVEVTSEDCEEALRETTMQIVEAVHSVLEKTPPELAADIADRGIVLTGGGALLRGLEELLEEKTGINTMTAEDSMKCVAIGTGKFVEFMAGNREDLHA